MNKKVILWILIQLLTQVDNAIKDKTGLFLNLNVIVRSLSKNFEDLILTSIDKFKEHPNAE